MQQNTICLISRSWNEIDLAELLEIPKLPKETNVDDDDDDDRASSDSDLEAEILEIPESPEETNDDDDDSSASSASSDSDLEESKTTNYNQPDLTSFKVYPCRAAVISQLTRDEPLSLIHI